MRPTAQPGSEGGVLPRPLLAIFWLVVLAELIAPFVSTTYGVDGHDHLNWIRQFGDLILSGDLLPRWAPDGYFGFGASTFYFYPPLTYYLSTLIRVLTGSTEVHFLFHMTGLVASVASALSARYLLRKLGSKGTQLNIGALLYAVAPFRVAELYSRSSLSSHVGYIFIPLMWAAAIGLLSASREERRSSTLLLAVSASLSILSSIPLFLLTAVSIAVAALVSVPSLRELGVPRLRASLQHLALASVLTAALVAVAVAPVISAMPYVQLGVLSSAEKDFVLLDLLHGRELAYVYHVGILYVGVIGILLLALRRSSGTATTGEVSGARPSAVRADEHALDRVNERALIRVNERALIRVAIGLLVMMVVLEIPPIADVIWRRIPPFTLIQVSWRFYIQFALLLAVWFGLARSAELRRGARFALGVTVIGALLPIGLIVSDVHLFKHHEPRALEPAEYLPRYTVSMREIDRLAVHQADSAACGLPANSQIEQIRGSGPRAEEYHVQLSTAATVTFHRFYWPMWHLLTDTRELAASPDSLGRAVVSLPAGQYRVRWQLERTPLELAGIWISVPAWITVLVLFLMGIRKRSRTSAEHA